MKDLSDGSKSLYLDIYRNGKRTYEYLKMYLIPETDENARRRNKATMNAANAIKSKRIIEMTNGEAGIENERRKSFCWTGCKPTRRIRKRGERKTRTRLRWPSALSRTMRGKGYA